MPDSARVAIDIGGTFTDVVLRSADGELRSAKVLTTPENIAGGIMHGVAAAEADPAELSAFVHGTTIALNALLEGKTPQVGLITTEGFRDVLEIMRTNRPDMYDHQQDKPVPIVPRKWRREISARMNYLGETMIDVESSEVESIAAEFAAAGISTIAVALLHAYANPDHEKAVEEILLTTLPDCVVSLSSDVSRVWREFERTSTTVCNAATKPIMSGYLGTLERSLSDQRFAGQVLIMQSNGGVMSASDARERPVSTVMSGPVGGVIGATRLARSSEEAANLVTLDIGGTSADVAIIDRGDPVTKTVGQIGPWPVMVPMVDVESIGAGGGSIASVDTFGRLTVGPQSAGAHPGPACYGQGGTRATVTDAHVVLGRINPGYLLGGDLTLDVDAAREAVMRDVGEPYGMTCEEAALGIVTVINSNMTRLLWEVMIGRGYDPRDFALLAFGGAGPLHACELALALGIRRVIVPIEPGTFSALGILEADPRHDYERMLVGAGAETSAETVEASFRELEEEGRDRLEREHAGYDWIDFVRSAELRYVGQDHPLSVDLRQLLPDEDIVSAARRLFHEAHDRFYGFRRTDTPVELVRIQLSAVGHVSRDALKRNGEPSHRVPQAAADRATAVRRLYSGGAFQDVSVYPRAQLDRGLTTTGPCVVEEQTSTTYVPARATVTVLPDQSLSIDLPDPLPAEAL
jgi:N-methylhydantoinase A